MSNLLSNLSVHTCIHCSLQCSFCSLKNIFLVFYVWLNIVKGMMCLQIVWFTKIFCYSNYVTVWFKQCLLPCLLIHVCLFKEIWNYLKSNNNKLSNNNIFSRPRNWPLLTIESPVAQWLEHPTRSWRVVGSIPTWDSEFFPSLFFPCIYIWYIMLFL